MAVKFKLGDTFFSEQLPRNEAILGHKYCPCLVCWSKGFYVVSHFLTSIPGLHEITTQEGVMYKDKTIDPGWLRTDNRPFIAV